jgi:hypothetical protein
MMRQAGALSLAGIVLRWVWRAPGAGEIAEVDLDNLVLGMEFALDGGEGAEEEVAGIGHDGGAARWDAVFGLEMKEAGDELVDGDGGLKFGETRDKFGGEVRSFVAFVATAGMVEAEVSGRIGDVHAAPPFASVVFAAAMRRRCWGGEFVDGIGVSDCVAHDMPRFPEK